MKYVEGIAVAMREAFEEQENTILLGQGVTDFKAIFNTVNDLHIDFPGRVFETPISEDSVMGMCIGASMSGMYPINTHIRADFSLLIFNQLINLAAKYKYMFGGLFEVPMLIRLVIGRSWGQGAQHSQSLQSMFSHVPGIVVIMPSTPQDIIQTYRYARKFHKGPVVSLEHRLMYDINFDEKTDPIECSSESLNPKVVQPGDDVTIVATSIMVLEAKRASKILVEEGISVEIIDLVSPTSKNMRAVLESIRKTKRLLIADTSWLPFGVAAEISRLVLQEGVNLLDAPVVCLGMANAPCPTAKSLEDIYYPTIQDIRSAVYKILKREEPSIMNLPLKLSMADFYKTFKGPF
ncbi:alpha-ketoacid dehydrogenase subunit beta [Alphaproteobacteria bacterium]|nr:alpha-ketoacid dehydrogenase subunit beta [Alphaproteobacteria bacterium]